ncbi:polysaccharide deacetylase family protein [Streptomyces sp. bgisy022]|uniref:polysaccharide deacetylase family protein n=1 Tax=Streptomyces sp. bgisy022 TaxID=3413769 RepID=UPI003D70B06E
MAATHRIAAGAVIVAVCAASLAACGTDTENSAKEREKAKPAPAPKNVVQLIGDGSTAYTGAQPHLPEPERLKPGEKPPQFVVFSWDGAGEDSQKLFSHFRKVAKENNATMTYFLSGVYMLPEEKRDLYRPPQHSPGRSDIGFNDRQGITDTVKQLRLAWLEGNEIGTHFNGHFCGNGGGVGEWSVEEWKDEISQAKWFVKTWKTNTGVKNAAPLPFDYDKELIGARTPCLEGQENFMKAARDLGFRYDTSGVNNQVWPKKKDGLWDLSLQLVPFPGRSFETLSMDYNYMVNQSGTTTQGDPAKHEQWGDEMRDSLLQGFDRAYNGNRAPLIIGNHFESWNGGTYMRAVEEVVETVCTKSEVRCVSFRQLVDWLDAQDPKTLEKLRGLGVGEAPKKDWKSYLAAAAPAPAPKGVPGAPAAKD